MNLPASDKTIATAWFDFLGPHIKKLIKEAIVEANAMTKIAVNSVKAKEALSKWQAVGAGVDLWNTRDAAVWAEEFLRINPDAKDFSVMVGWFANAIMTGYDHAKRGTEKTAEVPGEREVWAQAYTAMLPYTDPGMQMDARCTIAATYADDAAKAFRERYK